MKSASALRNRLAELSPEELAELLTVRRLLHGQALPGRPEPQTLAQLADRLLDDRSVAEAVAGLNTPELQLLGAAVRLAARTYGPLQPGPYWTPFEPSTRTVPAGRLLDHLAQGDPTLRTAAERTLAGLRARMLVLPAARGEVALPSFVQRHLGESIGLGRPLAPLMSDAFNAPEVHRIAAGLDLADRRNREQAQAAIVQALGDGERVRALAAAAPPAARELLDRLTAGPPLLRTHCFVPLGGRYYGPASKFELRHGGSGDPGTDWLAAHGLVVPVGPDLVELPFEVGDALQDNLEGPRFTPAPPALAEGLLPVAETLPEAQSAAAGAVRRVELLLAACAVAPGSLRKAGGLALRDAKRLAKAVDAPEAQTRLWIDLAFHADLLGLHEEQPDAPPARGRGRRSAPVAGPVRLLPTGRYDGWQSGSPAERLVPLVSAWAVVPEVLSWWPDDHEQQPFALVPPEDGEAVQLRQGVLSALAALPPGLGLGPAAALQGEALLGLVRRVDWYSPGLVPLTESGLQRVVATLAEAELLGVAAHGRLTTIGEAVVELLASGAAAEFPYVPGSTAGPSAGDGAAAAPLARLRGALADLLPPPRTTARFQADLTAIATGAPSPELAELLGSAADRESEGHAVVWRFGAASVRRALDGGLAAEELLARLRAAAEGELPQPLEYLVRDTGRTHGRMRVVRSACCIRSDDETLLVELEKSRMLAKLELRLIAPTVLISTQPPTATLQALRAAGYAPVLEAETGVTVVERAPELRAATRMPALARRRTGRTDRSAVLESAARLLAGG